MTLELDSSELDELWLLASKEQLRAPARALDVTKSDLAFGIAEVMRSHCPAPGDTWDTLTIVIMKPGASVDLHQHDRHTIIYYPEACDPIVVAGKQIDLAAGHILYIPPNTPHEVPAVKRTRLCVGMLIS